METMQTLNTFPENGYKHKSVPFYFLIVIMITKTGVLGYKTISVTIYLYMLDNIFNIA